MSKHDASFRKIFIGEEVRLSGAKKLLFRDDDIAIWSDADGSITIQTDATIKLDANTTMQTGHQFNGAADGVVMFSKAGTISDADYTTDTTGLIGIDTSNDRLYYRIGAADWSYVSADGGFSFPERRCPVCREIFKIGDRIDMMINRFDSDGAVHAVPVHRRCQ